MDCVQIEPIMSDRLSMLPDDIIHNILSFVTTKHGVQTSALSSRWRFLWTSMPCFNISTDDFSTLHKLPALTTLHLDYVAFHEDNLFSKCANLKNLTLNNFAILESDTFTLCHPRLSNLTLIHGHYTLKAVNVVAPQLENLTIRSRFDELLITAPNLVTLLLNFGYIDWRHLQFSTDLTSLEKVDLCISFINGWSGCRSAALLQQLRNARFLTLNLEFIKPLISYMEGISLQPSPFSNLKSLKIYPAYVNEEPHKQVIMTPEVINYLLDGSPSATFKLISYEEIKEKRKKALAIKNAARARRLIAKLEVDLEEKANIETVITRVTPMESHEEVERMQLQFKRKLVQVNKGWEDVGARIDQGKRDAHYIIYLLRDIEVLLLKDLPTSERDELQACFSSLSAEVDTVVKKIVHHMMQILSSDYFDELATASLPSS